MPLMHKGDTHHQVMYAECAGISELKDEERSTVEKLVERILNSAQFAPSYPRNRPTPIKEKPRRMSPMLLSVAQ